MSSVIYFTERGGVEIALTYEWEEDYTSFAGLSLCREDYSRIRQGAPELWHHRIKKKTYGASLVHRGSVYHTPHKDRGQHFAIHPEWPIA